MPDEQTIFDAARRIADPQARTAYVDDACGSDDSLRRRVDALLHAHEGSASFLGSPVAIGVGGTTLENLVTPPHGGAAGTVIGRYKLLEPIGEGGYGTVFMAEQTTPVQRRVALKIIKAGISDGAGGAIYNSAGTLTISNCTFWNNGAIGGSTHVLDDSPNGYHVGYTGYGGALYLSGGTASIDHSTFAGNYALPGYADPGYEGAAYGGTICNFAGPGAARIYNTILADTDLYGSVTSLGHNLIEHTSGAGGFAASDLLNVDPLLGPLQNNGGPTRTIMLLAGSPAINAGDNANAPANDQRGVGYARIVGGTIDIGAFESGAAVAGKNFVGPGGAGSGGNWSNANNWSPSGVPAATDNVSVAGKSVNLGDSAIVASLTLTGGATLSVAANGTA